MRTAWRRALVGLAIGAMGAALIVGDAAGAEEPEEAKMGVAVGDKAPNFKLVATDGMTYTLEQFRDKSWVVLAWYPKALTGG